MNGDINFFLPILNKIRLCLPNSKVKMMLRLYAPILRRRVDPTPSLLSPMGFLCDVTNDDDTQKSAELIFILVIAFSPGVVHIS